MKRFSINRALEDYLNRPLTRADVPNEDQAKKMIERRQLLGCVGRTRFQTIVELNDELARRLVAQCDMALADGSLHEGKRGAIELARKQILEHFPGLA